jgi:hypothetical protein
MANSARGVKRHADGEIGQHREAARIRRIGAYPTKRGSFLTTIQVNIA